MGSVTKLPSYGNSQFIRKIITFLLRLKGIKKAQKTAYMTRSIQYINICAVLNHFTSRQFLLEFRCNSSWTMISHIKHANWKKKLYHKVLNCQVMCLSKLFYLCFLDSCGKGRNTYKKVFILVVGPLRV